jgi:hypothetical protein
MSQSTAISQSKRVTYLVCTTSLVIAALALALPAFAG